MLFILTGNVQTGKTRWLEGLVSRLECDGVACFGVLAPGIWRERAAGGPAGGSAPEDGVLPGRRFEKLGIENLLLPQRERVPFARRRDLADRDGASGPASQSAAARLAWEISEEALERVNAHFAALAQGCGAAGVRPAAAGRPAPRPAADGLGEKQTDVSRETSNLGAGGGGPLRATDGAGAARATDEADVADAPDAPCAARAADAADAPRAAGGLLVVDELGRLELLHDGGLVQAMELVEAGPTPAFPHALVVVRASLLNDARERFAGAWGRCEAIGPDGAGFAAVRRALRK